MVSDTEILALVEPIVEEAGLELVELTCRPLGSQLLVRVLVDRAGGVTLQQCSTVNRRIGEAFDAANLIEERYTIEVSSPGLDRPLVSKRDFERAVGEDVRLELNVDEGRHRELQGVLLAVQPEAIVVKTLSGNVTIPMAQVRTAKKALRW